MARFGDYARRIPPRGSAGDGPPHLSRAGLPSVFRYQRGHPFIGETPNHQLGDLRSSRWTSWPPRRQADVWAAS